MAELCVFNFHIELDSRCLCWCHQASQPIGEEHFIANFVLDACVIPLEPQLHPLQSGWGGSQIFQADHFQGIVVILDNEGATI